MSLKSTKWLQEGLAIRKKEWTQGAFIMLIKKGEETFILSHWPQKTDDFVFIPGRQLPRIVLSEQNWPDTYEQMPDQFALRKFVLQRVQNISFYDEVDAIRRAYNYFRYNREQISREAKKRFVVIQEETVIGEYDDPIDAALNCMAEGKQLGEFIVQDLSVDTMIFHSRASFKKDEN